MPPRLDGFRLRGLEMTRLKAFVDAAAFAFAVTMLIIAGQQLPDDAAALLKALQDVPAFAASIATAAKRGSGMNRCLFADYLETRFRTSS